MLLIRWIIIALQKDILETTKPTLGSNRFCYRTLKFVILIHLIKASNDQFRHTRIWIMTHKCNHRNDGLAYACTKLKSELWNANVGVRIKNWNIFYESNTNSTGYFQEFIEPKTVKIILSLDWTKCKDSKETTCEGFSKK